PVLENPLKTSIVPPAPERNRPATLDSADREALLGLIKRYEAAYRGRSMGDIEKIFPRIKTSALYDALDREFLDPKGIAIQVDPQSDPVLEGDLVTIRCRQVITRSPKSGLFGKAPKSLQEQSVNFHFKRIGGTWLIVSIQ